MRPIMEVLHELKNVHSQKIKINTLKRNRIKIDTTMIEGERDNPIFEHERYGNVKMLLAKKYKELLLDIKAYNRLNRLIMGKTKVNDGRRSIKDNYQVIEKYLNLELPIPMKFLNILGLNIDELKEGYQKDLSYFKRALRSEHLASNFWLIHEKGVHIKPFPRVYNLDKAINWLQCYSTISKNSVKMIYIPGLKSIIFEDDKNYSVTTFPPEMSIRGDLLYFTNVNISEEIKKTRKLHVKQLEKQS